jgi:hypothetical protein
MDERYIVAFEGAKGVRVKETGEELVVVKLGVAHEDGSRRCRRLAAAVTARNGPPISNLG